LGNVPGVVFVNSYDLDDVLAREKRGSRVREIALAMERERRGSIYPHKIFPIAAEPEEFSEEMPYEVESRAISSGQASTLRLGRMISSPFIKAELYGGEKTRKQLEPVLCDPAVRSLIRKQESAFIKRLEGVDDGVAILQQLAMQKSIAGHTAL
jgi:hypothetical protein